MRRACVGVFALLGIGCGGHTQHEKAGIIVTGTRMAAPNHTGLVLYTAYEAYRNPLMWLDLATGVTGELDYRQEGEGADVMTDRTAVWMLGMRETGKDAIGALRVARGNSGVGTQFVPDVFARSVSPDGTRAVISIENQLHEARVATSSIAPGKKLGVELSFTNIYGWRANGVVVSGRADDVLYVTVDTRPTTVRTGVMNGDSTCGSSDGALIAWVPSSYDALTDEQPNVSPSEQVLHIASLTEPRTPARVFKLGLGEDTRCEFAPDARTLVCLVAPSSMAAKRALSIDVATGAVRTLAAEVEYGLAFSPDNRFVMLADKEIIIAALDGTTRVTLPHAGAPIAWLR